MAYDKRLETNRAAMKKHNETQQYLAGERLKRVAAQVKAKRSKKEASA